MSKIDRERLKQEIDQLDSAYFDLALRVLRQIPHQAPATPRPSPAHQPSFAARWRGRFALGPSFADEAATDPKLVYLAERYRL